MVAASRALGSNYELISLIGTGAMGEVWRTLDRARGTEVAAKVLRSEYARNPEIIGRFVQERSILLSLDHPGIVRVHDLVVEGDSLAIVMDLVEGQDLRAVLRERGTLAPAEAAGAVALVLDALAAAHAQGTLHRDVKPDNVLVGSDWEQLAPGSVRLSDFSIARLAQESTVQATGLLGTPEYMPPELFEHGTSSAASDVYAAGVLLYELLAGRTPYAGEGTAYTIGNRAVTAEPPALQLPAPLWELLTTLLGKDPRRRLTAAAAAESLRTLVPGLTGVPALMVQPTPASWQRTGAPELHRGPIREASPAALDVGSTNLDVTFTPEAPQAASAGEVRALAPQAHAGLEAGLEAGVTNVGLAPVQEYHPPQLQPRVQAPEAKKPRRPWVTWLVGVAMLALVVGLVLGGKALFGGDDAQGRGTTATGAVVSRLDDPKVAGSGLSVRREATYDPESRSIELTMQLATDRVALGGPFLQVVPAEPGAAECPQMTFDVPAHLVIDPITTGVSAHCAWQLDVDVPEGGTATVTGVVHRDLGGEDAQARLDAWLRTLSESTTTALAAIGPTKSTFGVQRLEGVEVTTPAFVTTRSAQVRVRVLARYPSGTDQQHPLFDSSTGRGSELLEKLAGGPGGVRLAGDCDGGVIIDDANHVSVLHQTPACEITATIGNLADQRSSRFEITGLGG